MVKAPDRKSSSPVLPVQTAAVPASALTHMEKTGGNGFGQTGHLGTRAAFNSGTVVDIAAISDPFIDLNHKVYMSQQVPGQSQG